MKGDASQEFTMSRCPACGGVLTLPPPGESMVCPHCQAGHAPAVLQRLRAEAVENDAHKNRNYTPDRGMRRMMRGAAQPGTQPALQPGSQAVQPPVLPSPHSSLPHPGPAPAPEAAPAEANHFEQPVPSHALAGARHGHRLRVAAFGLAGLLVAGVAAFLFSRGRGSSPPPAAEFSGHLPLPVPDAPQTDPTAIIAPGEIESARRFLKQQLAAAADWRDLLPLVRQRGEVEPLMAEFYAGRPFEPWKAHEIAGERPVVNKSGRFVVLLLDPGNRVVMVQITPQGCLLDWEMSVNYPLHQWDRLLAERPLEKRMVRVLAARCYVRPDLLAEAERPLRDQLLGVRLSMPGREDLLFAALEADSELGRWIMSRLPWEHENQSMMLRAELAFDPAHQTIAERVVFAAVQGESWNR
jgi:hypothetical protein